MRTPVAIKISAYVSFQNDPERNMAEGDGRQMDGQEFQTAATDAWRKTKDEPATPGKFCKGKNG